MNLCVVGLGKLGSCLATVLAHAGHDVFGIDRDGQIVASLNAGQPPFPEPGLAEVLSGLPDGRLSAATSFEAVTGADMTFLVVPTPSDPQSGRFDPSMVIAAAVSVAEQARGPHILVVVSTVMPGDTAGVITAEWEDALDIHVHEEGQFPVVYMPEFIALGSVISDMQNPDVTLIGAQDRSAAERVAAVVLPMQTTRSHVAIMSTLEAEVAKLALNAYVTTKISFANMIGEACDRAGADALRVLDAVGHDRRVGTAYLRPGGPYGGTCFPRDGAALTAWLDRLDVPAYLPWATGETNRHQVERAVVALSPYNTVAVLGLTYKVGSPVTEESFGIKVATALTTAGVTVHDYDPMAGEVGTYLHSRTLDPQAAVDAAEAVLIALPDPAYANLDYGDRFVYDPWGIRA